MGIDSEAELNTFFLVFQITNLVKVKQNNPFHLIYMWRSHAIMGKSETESDELGTGKPLHVETSMFLMTRDRSMAITF